MDFVFGQVCCAWNQRCFTPMCYGASSGPDGFCLRAGLLGLEPTLFHTHVLCCKFWTRWILSSGRSVVLGMTLNCIHPPPQRTNNVSVPVLSPYRGGRFARWVAIRWQ